MSYFKAKMHQNRLFLLVLGVPPQTLLGELTALPRLPGWISGALTSKEGERRRRKDFAPVQKTFLAPPLPLHLFVTEFSCRVFAFSPRVVSGHW